MDSETPRSEKFWYIDDFCSQEKEVAQNKESETEAAGIPRSEKAINKYIKPDTFGRW